MNMNVFVLSDRREEGEMADILFHKSKGPDIIWSKTHPVQEYSV